MASMARRLARSLLLVLSFLPFVPRALAQTGNVEPVQADDALGRALEAYEAGRFAEARHWFVVAHDRDPSARTLRGLGVVSYALGEYLEAVTYLEASLRHPVRPLTDELRALVESLLVEAKSHLAQVRIENLSAGGVVRIDDARAALDENASVFVDPGHHVVRIDYAGHSPIERPLDLAPGESATIDGSAAPPVIEPMVVREDALPVVPRAEAAPERATRSTRDSTRAHRKRFVLGLGVGAAASVIAGTTMLGVAAARFRDLERACDAGCAPDRIQSRYDGDHIHPLSVAGITALSIGGALGVSSLVLLVSRPRAAPNDGLTVLLGPTVVGVRGRF